MKNENEGIELNIIKGIIGISGISSVSQYRKLITFLEHLLDYNDHVTKYNINQINFISLRFGTSVCGVRKNGEEIRLTQRWRKI